MTRTRSISKELNDLAGQEVLVKGWLHTIRELGKVNFLIVRDGWGFIQCVIDKTAIVELRDIQSESIIEVIGTVVEAKQAPNGVELHNCQIVVIEAVTEQLPFELNQKRVKAKLDTFLNHAQLGFRHPKRKALLQLAAGVMAGFRHILTANDFIEIQSPKLVASATEGGANVFEVGYFGKPAYLAQSPQFYKQMMVGIFERVFEVGPVFRAEPHDTSRHINEYVSLDIEFGFIEDHTTVMAMATTVIKGIFIHLAENYSQPLNLLDISIPVLPYNLPAISFSDAQDYIYRQYKEDCRGEADLAPHHERWLGEWAKKEYNSDFLYVTGYPMTKRPFYTHPNPNNPKFSNSFDLLFRGAELITGGQRLHSYPDYLQALKSRGLSPTGFESYLNAFRYGMPPHGGFAIGLERFLMQLTGAANIKEVTLFPRDMNRLEP
jgi:nondiscriminating aspartyl-tRNA synthetase